jgi:hypothetical protein
LFARILAGRDPLVGIFLFVGIGTLGRDLYALLNGSGLE